MALRCWLPKRPPRTIPIVFVFGGDPVGEGFVVSLNRPGGNITGASFFGSVLGGKALGLLQELVPNAAVTALLVNPRSPESAHVLSDTQEAARMLGRQLLVLNASTPGEIETAFATLREQRAGALLADGDAFLAPGGSKSLRSRRVTPSPPCTPIVISSMRAG